MTTTAEKIEQLSLRLEGLRDMIGILEDELIKLKQDERSGPLDPEPLEFRANQYKDGNIVAFTNIDTAMLVAQQNDAPRQAVLVREVTPQDEQDRQDAARYRYLKEKESCVPSSKAPIYMHSPYQWDKMIDKAMEEKT